tara:strand:- start:240 stop:509 length:270 start_codon:yes stop_codon:yes gene_type:complete
MKFLVTLIICLLLVSCAPDNAGYPPLWVKSLETMPRENGYRNAGIYGMNDNVYAQFCDSHGNQKWFSYNKETHTWKQTRYETHGCKQDS